MKESAKAAAEKKLAEWVIFFYIPLMFKMTYLTVRSLERAKAKAERLEKENADAELKAKAETVWVDIIHVFFYFLSP